MRPDTVALLLKIEEKFAKADLNSRSEEEKRNKTVHNKGSEGILDNDDINIEREIEREVEEEEEKMNAEKAEKLDEPKMTESELTAENPDGKTVITIEKASKDGNSPKAAFLVFQIDKKKNEIN